MEGDSARAVKYNTRATEATERNINLYLTTGSERQKLAYVDTLARQIDQTISLHVRFAPDQPQARELAAANIIRRKGRVLDEMAETLIVLRRRLSLEDRAALDQLNETTSQLARLVLNGPQRITLAEHQNRIKALSEQQEKLEADISLARV
jgi:hypothetical protein